MTTSRKCVALALVLGVSGCAAESDQGSPLDADQLSSRRVGSDSGGSDSGRGGTDLGPGGNPVATGGETNGTGGSAAATGGSAAATGGSAAATGGSAAATGGQANGTVGDTGGTSGGSMPPSTEVGTQGVTRGQLLFSDDFERTNPEQNGWSSGYVNGVWTIENGVLTASSDLQHSATLINRTAWRTGIFEFDVNHSGGNIFGFIANANGHSFAALFARGGTVIINDQEFDRSARPAWPDLTPGVWYRITIIVSRDAAEILLDGESVGVLESPGIGTIERHLFQIRNHQDGMTVSFDNFELWEVVE